MLELRELLAVNDSFYRAFEQADAGAMDALWAGEPGDVCVHPGWEPTRGAINVANTWRRIFAGPSRLRFRLGQVHAEIHGTVGIVYCTENIWAAESGEIVGRVAATNLFRKIDGRWRMVLHHGSPVPGAPDAVTTSPDDLDN
jgi:ketosteroid isomerase-like protein